MTIAHRDGWAPPTFKNGLDSDTTEGAIDLAYALPNMHVECEDQPPFLPWPRFYQKGDWRNRRGDLTDTIHRADDGVWPREFQRDEYYSRAGEGGSSASPSISKSYYEQFRKSFEATRPESPSAGTVNSFRKPLVVRQNADADSCRPASGWLPLFYHSAMV